MSKLRGKIKWGIGIFLMFVAAGGGGNTWPKFFELNSAAADTANDWSKAQPYYFKSFDFKNKSSTLWPIGLDKGWQRELKNGTYCLTNRINESSVKYQFLGPKDARMASFDLPVSVDIQMTDSTNFTHLSGAGLLYRFDEEKRFYYAAVLTPDGKLSVYKRNDTGFNSLYSGPVDSFNEQSFNRLSMIGREDELHIYVNEESIRTVTDSELQQGVYGIVGSGIGSYCFDNFTIYEPMDKLPE